MDTTLQRLLKDEIAYAEAFCRVVDMKGQTVPFRTATMPMQQHFVETFIKPNIVRVVELKARRVGGTTLFMILGMVRASLRRNFSCLLLAQDEPEALKFMKMWKLLYTNTVPQCELEDGTIFQSRPDVGVFSDHMIEFPALGSRLTVGSAGSLKFGRGMGFNMVIGTEVAKWDVGRPIGTAQEAWAMVEGALVPGGFAVCESTAFGAGGFFHGLYTGAKSGENGWKAAFYDWRCHPLYILAPDDSDTLEEDRKPLLLNEEEARLNLTQGQARWRRAKIARMPGSTLEAKRGLFFQEYPEDDITCFLTSGNPFFDINRIDTMIREARPILQSEESGRLLTWVAPRVGERYVIGADPGGELSVRRERHTGHDNAAAVVVDSRGNHVASLCGQWDTRTFAEGLAKLGSRYNNALIVVESGPYGDAVLLVLATYLDYPNIFAEKDEKGRPVRLGQRTTDRSKPKMADELKEWFETGAFRTDDKDLLGEMRNFHKIPGETGHIRLQAIAGHDDRPIAAMLAVWGWREGNWRQKAGGTIYITEGQYGNT